MRDLIAVTVIIALPILLPLILIYGLYQEARRIAEQGNQ